MPPPMRTSRLPWPAAWDACRRLRMGLATYHASRAATARLASSPPTIGARGKEKRSWPAAPASLPQRRARAPAHRRIARRSSVREHDAPAHLRTRPSIGARAFPSSPLDTLRRGSRGRPRPRVYSRARLAGRVQEKTRSACSPTRSDRAAVASSKRVPQGAGTGWSAGWARRFGQPYRGDTEVTVLDLRQHEDEEELPEQATDGSLLDQLITLLNHRLDLRMSGR